MGLTRTWQEALLARNWFSMRERSREALTIASVAHVWLSETMMMAS
jgi:hypothetical protein